MQSALRPKKSYQAFRELLSLLTRYRVLTFEMARREISDRYAGQVLGMFWAFGHPLVMILVYVFIFGFVFKMKIGGTLEMPYGYTTYLLSGLIPWLSFQESMAKASTVMTNNANLVKQVIFPLEVLPVKGVLATLFTQIVLSTFFVVYVLITEGMLHWTFLLLPVLFLIQAMAMIGVSYVLSSVGVYFRDMKDFVQIFLTIGFYMIPAIYVPKQIPETFQIILNLNPFSYMVRCYQDALYYGRFEHPSAWVIFPLLSLLVFIYGYRLFRRLKPMFGNVL